MGNESEIRYLNPITVEVKKDKSPKAPSDGKKGSKKNEEKVVTTPRHGSDDGKSLWVNPAPGKPLLLDYLPPGCQLFLMLRPGELEKAESRSNVWRALGPRAAYYREQLEQLLCSHRGKQSDVHPFNS